jgi:predicted glycosyltransferase
MRVLFHVQHLLGIGHVRRAALIARALAADGAQVTVAQGGFPVPGADFGGAEVIALPPVRAADAAFSALVGPGGRPADAAWEARRRDALLAAEDRVRPDVVLVETYPFGRRRFRFELEPLLDRALARRPRPLTACSVRDILVRKDDPARHAQVAETVRRRFDLVLVHGDPRLVPLEASFPAADRIADRIRYTGYVASPDIEADPGAGSEIDPEGADGRGEAVVSVGGGAVGAGLLHTALAARPLSPLADAPWRLLYGPDLPSGTVAALRNAAPDGVTVEPARPDFPALLRRCRLSISQAGYNTVMDVLAAGCPAVLVPFAAGAETEQTDRARLLADRGLVRTVAEHGLTPAGLAEAIAAALAAPPRRNAAAGLAVDGARQTARLLRAALAERRPPRNTVAAAGRDGLK